MKHLLLADDLSNQSLFGFRRSIRLKQISLQFCSRIGAELKLVHVDHPKSFQFREPLYKKYLDHDRLNRKARFEILEDGKKVRMEYVLAEGEPISKLLELITKPPHPIGAIVGTSNRFLMGAFHIGSRTKRLVSGTTLPVFIFGLAAIKNFEYDSKNDFRVTLVIDSGAVTDFQIKSIQTLVNLYRAKLSLVIFKKKKSILRLIYRKLLATFRPPPHLVDLNKLKTVFVDAQFIETHEGFSLRRSMMKEIRRTKPHLLAVPEDFGISPFSLARRSKIPIFPLRDI